MNGEACGAGQNLTVVACRFKGALLRKLKVLEIFMPRNRGKHVSTENFHKRFLTRIFESTFERREGVTRSHSAHWLSNLILPILDKFIVFDYNPINN